LGVLGGREDEVLQDLDLRRVDQLGIDLHRAHLALAVERDRDHAAAGLAAHLHTLELGLHLGHAGLHRLGLLHELAEILHSSDSPSSGSDGSAALSAAGAPRSRTASMTLPGKAAIAAWTSGWRAASSRTAATAAWLCSSMVGSPGSLEIETIQRRPVHSVSLRPRRLARLAGACGPGRNSMRPTSKRTRWTWRTRLVRRIRSPSASARATTSVKLCGCGPAAAVGLGAAAGAASS